MAGLLQVMNWYGSRRKRSIPYSKYYHIICWRYFEKSRKYQKIFSPVRNLVCISEYFV